ncbi:glycosyltransferase family 2 protein, partial [bacterium]|nr:glycosyltransferase family 2 protein [bacterium]
TSESYEILVIDDASTDRTAEIAQSKGVKVIKRVIRGGSGAARKTGIKEALGDIIVMLDVDGSYTASDIPEMLKFFPEYDQVIGARRSEEGSLKFLRIPAKWFIRALASYLSKTKIPDLNSGLRAFKKSVMLKYLWAIPDGFSCVSSMTLSFLCNGHPVRWIPTEYHSRIGKSKFHPIKDTSNYILTVIKMIMYYNPLKVFLPISLSLLAIGVVKTLYDKFLGIGRMQLSDIVILMTGVVVGTLGLIADLIVAQGRRGNGNTLDNYK